MKKKVVIALGGNALGNTPSEQLKLVKITAKTIVNLVQDGYRVIVTHGNGPQVGMINLAMESASETIDTPEKARRVLELGCFSVVVGSIITRPQLITKRFVDCIEG